MPAIKKQVNASSTPRRGTLSEVVCYQGEWSLYLFTGISPDRSGSPSPATLIIDGQIFDTTFGLRPPSADEGLVITPQIIEALKSGSQVEITFPTGGTPYSATFGLSGSSRALGAVEAGCAYPTRPLRLLTASDRVWAIALPRQ
jgi:hypothetical protein